MGWLADTLVKDPGPALARFAKMIGKHPLASTALGGTAIAAGTSFGPEAVKAESEFMKNRLGAPGGKFVYASENVQTFLEEEFKKEAGVGAAASPGAWNTAWQAGVKDLAGGVGAGIGAAGVTVLVDILRKAGKGLSQKLVYDNQRKELLRKIIAADPIVSTFEAQNPGMALRVYASMVSVAPKLSLDPNAVTSFLREAAQTHGAINYLTIKQLAETEQAIEKSEGTFKDIFLKG